MSTAVFVTLALRGLARNRRRSAITLAPVTIGLAGLVFLWAYVEGVNRQMIGNITSYLTGHVQVHERGYHDDPTLDLAFSESSRLSSMLTAQSSIAAVAPRVEGEALASGTEKTRGLLIIDIDPRREQHITTLAKTVESGSYLDTADPKGILLGKQVAKVLQVALGDEVTLGGALGSAVVGYLGVRGMHMEQYAEAVQTMPGLTGTVYPHISLPQLLILSALLLATTVLASLYPAWKAARVTPVEAIRGVVQSARRRRRRSTPSAVPLPARLLFIRIALRNLLRNPRRALLTLAALSAGFAAYLFLGALIRGFFIQMRDNATDLLTGHVQIEARGFRDDFDPKLTLSNADEILEGVRASPEVAAATPRLQAMTMVSSPTQTEPVMLYGVDPDTERKVTRLNEALREGQHLTAGKAREMLIGRSLADRLGVRLGEKFVVMAPAADGSLGSAALRVAGIYETGNEVYDRNSAVTTLAAAHELLGTPSVSAIVVRLRDSGQVEAAAAQLAPLLKNSDQQVVTWKILLPQVVQMLDLSTVDLYVVLLVVFLVVALGVTNTLLMAVLERTREFGLQLALGTRPAQIVRTVLYESLVLGVIGLGAGFLLGAAIVAYYRAVGFDMSSYSAIVKAIPGLTGVLYPTIVAGDVWIPMLALLATSVAAALYPAWRAARLDAIQALRHV